MPPPYAFQVIWSVIAVLRTVSSTIVYDKQNTLLCRELLTFVAHLCIGDTWNTINNVENRLGTAALGVNFVFASVWYTIYRYHKCVPLAGYILAPSGVWLSVATVLIYTIWKLNYEGFNHPSYLPTKGEGHVSKWWSRLSKNIDKNMKEDGDVKLDLNFNLPGDFSGGDKKII